MTMQDRQQFATINTMLTELSGKLERLTGSIQGNGGKGLAGQITDNSLAVDRMEKHMEHMQTVEGCAQNQNTCRGLQEEQMKTVLKEALRDRGRSVWPVLEKVITVGVIIAALLFGQGLINRKLDKQGQRLENIEKDIEP